jgi:hypothetical protein
MWSGTQLGSHERGAKDDRQQKGSKHRHRRDRTSAQAKDDGSPGCTQALWPDVGGSVMDRAPSVETMSGIGSEIVPT